MVSLESTVLRARRLLGNQLKRLRAMREVASFDARELRDIGLSRNDASCIAAGAADTHERVEAMSRRLGVDPGHIAKSPWMRVDIVRACAQCKRRGECRLWLADHEADIGGYEAFCPNAERFKALQEGASSPSG